MTVDQRERLREIMQRSLMDAKCGRDLEQLIADIEQTAKAELVERVRIALNDHEGPGISG
jgi:hypothetical protein